MSITRKNAFLVLGYVACATLSGQLFGAELTPYTLPSERRGYLQPQENLSRQVAPKSATQAREEYYRTFELKIGGLPGIEKTRLIESFKQKQKSAEDKGNYDEARHYFQLQTILKESGKK